MEVVVEGRDRDEDAKWAEEVAVAEERMEVENDDDVVADDADDDESSVVE